MAPSVVEETALRFLQRVPPFQFLDEEALRRVVARAELHFFPKGTRILQRGGPPAEYLYVIERGGVRTSIETEAGGETTVEVAGDGELFGVLSSMWTEVSRVDVTAAEDTLCYAVPRPVVEELLENESAFAHYLLRFSVEHYLEHSLDQVRRSGGSWDSSERLLFASRARDIARTRLVTCPETATIQEAAQLMNDHRVSSVVVVGERGRATGIVTDWDLRERVVAAGRDVGQPVVQVMTRPVVTIDGGEPLFEIIRCMIAQNIHHLVVTEDTRPVGMIAGHDLIVLQGTSALFVARDIERQVQPAGLRTVSEQAQRVIPFLLRQGIRAGQLGRVMAEINDRLVARVVELTEAALGRAPVPYCWLALGSEGRQEQTFKTDQDNALIYADPPAETAQSAHEYFAEFSRRAVAGLLDAGFPPCPGHYTADNPNWTRPLESWCQQFQHWVARPEPQAVLHSLIFFDFRAIAGDASLADELHDFITRLLSKSPAFLVHMASISTNQRPPIGFLGRLIVEHSGEHRRELDLKHRGTGPVVDLARFFALQHGIVETSTLGRYELLKQGGHVPAETADELSQAFEFLLRLRVQHQWQQHQAGQALTNFVNPNQLAPLDRSLLREAFKAIARAQAYVREAYHTEGITT